MAMFFPYNFKEKYPSNTCLVKIWFGKKYFIWKAKALKQTADQVCRDLSRKVRNGCPETDLFYQVCRYIKRGRILSCTFEVIMTTDDHDILIQFEQEILDKFYGTPDCLNNNQVAYQPGWLILTSNKAIRTHMSVVDVSVDDKVYESLHRRQKIAPVPKPLPDDTAKKLAIERMKALKALRDGKI